MKLLHKKHKYPYEMSLPERTKALKKRFYDKVGYPLDVVKPQTFNEKINWMKLFYRNDLMPRIVDKYEFKHYIREQLGEGYTVPLLGAWDNVEDVDFDKLPNRFVLKCNAQSDSKFIKIVKNKAELDIEAIKQEMQDWLKPEKTLKSTFCWAYNSVPLKIIAEEYIEQIDGQVYDYKFMCFNGEPKWILACCDRGKNTVYENHDINWNLIIPSPKSATKAVINCPKNFSRMVEIAKKLSAPFPFVRVDFYEIEDSILLGEMTFYPNGGYNTYKPYWDKKFGEYINLPKIKIRPPFFEKVKDKSKRIIKICGKKVFSYHKSLSRKELTKELEQENENLKTIKNELEQENENLKTIKNELIVTINELHNAQLQIEKIKSDLSSRPKLQPSQMRFVERIEALKLKFYKQMGYKLNLENPQTINEKINWMKLFYRNPVMTRIVDKYEFKNYIKEQLGVGYTVPLLGAWDNVYDIDFNKLPNQFVLKCNAQSEGHYIKIVKNKDELDIETLKNELKNWLVPEYTLKTSYCWAYNNVPLKIYAEEYIDIPNNSKEYKVFCFNGKADFALIELDYFGENPQRAFYDRNFVETEFKIGTMPKVSLDEKPKNFDEMIELADKLAKSFPFVRVDFYDIEGKIYIGEMTFYSGGGYSKFAPIDWDNKLGSRLDLSKIPQEYVWNEN